MFVCYNSNVKKYMIQKQRKKIPIFFLFVILIFILLVEINFFRFLYVKRSKYLNLPDYQPIHHMIKGKLRFIEGDFPLSAKIGSTEIFIFKNLSLQMNKGEEFEIFSKKPYKLIFEDGFNKYIFFGKILYLRLRNGTN